MTYPITDQLRGWLMKDFPALAGMDSFEIDGAEFERNFRDLKTSKRPEKEIRDAAAFRCLTFGIVQEKPKETKPEQILIQQDQFLRVQSAHLEETKTRHGSVMVGVDSIRGDVAQLAAAVLEAQEKGEQSVGDFCDMIEKWQDAQAKLILLAESEEFASQRYGGLSEGIGKLRVELRELADRKPMFPKWAVIAFAVLVIVLLVLGVLR